ncbi:MAG TPA: hypothetical protein VKB93_23090 [Thermoanaerobaculia bacterium]|nr:hypothetical protein [Thermoanaerobaculia bacterium]
MKPAGPIHLLERDYFLRFNEHHDIWPPTELPLLTMEHAEADESVDPVNDRQVRRPCPKCHAPYLLENETKRVGRIEYCSNPECSYRTSIKAVWITDKWRAEPGANCGGYLCRELERLPAKDEPLSRSVKLREMMLRFPSAPLFGSQSKIDFQVHMRRFHQHTLRLLKAPAAAGDKPIKKLFLIFNGLNELDFYGFYYELAALLIDKAADPAEVACLVAPFPAHLTRYPLIGKYAEKPLQRFISDPSDLFRQYLRFMVETQWLISALVPVSHYPVTSGIPLLEPHTDPLAGRCDTKLLSVAVYKAWKEIFDASTRQEAPIQEDDVLQAITVLRELIGWQPSTTPLTKREEDKPLDPPQLHVIGYSLGGYLAQCAFFTWPYAIGSCSTLCSGGALTNLRPEKIIHEEEWRAITHGLKYEIESGMLEGRIGADDRNDPHSVCGIPVSYFASHFQMFTDIFLQDPHGTYRHRVSEFAPRLFFVVGGNDPIVPTQSVLETSPPEGVNMIAIARLSHFIAIEGGEWPSFWLPTIAGIISSLSDHSESLLRTTLLKNLWNDQSTNAPGEDDLDLLILEKHFSDVLKRGAKSGRRDAEPLDSEQLQMAILSFVELLEQQAFLIILRNQIPVTLMGKRVLHRRGTVPHYDDNQIRGFWARLQLQRLGMKACVDRLAIVVPGRLNQWFVQRPPTLSFKHLPVVQEFHDHDEQENIWQEFLADWEDKGVLYRFDPEYPSDISGERFALEERIRMETATPKDFWVLNCLPDTWISLSRKAVTDLAGGVAHREAILNNLGERMLLVYSGKGRKDSELTDDQRTAKQHLNDWLETGALQIIRISAAQTSPRFLGERIRDRDSAIELLTHTVLALARSKQCRYKGDFAKR